MDSYRRLGSLRRSDRDSHGEVQSTGRSATVIMNFRMQDPPVRGFGIQK